MIYRAIVVRSSGNMLGAGVAVAVALNLLHP